MVVDQTYVDEMEALYERAIMEIGKKLIAFYTGRDMEFMALYNDASVCFNVGRAIRSYDYDLGLITDDNLIKYREILGSMLIKYTKPILYTHVLNEYSEPVPVITPVIYAGTSSGGLILRSIDLGLTFEVFATSINGNITCFAIAPNGKVYYGTDTGRFINLTDNEVVSTNPFTSSGRINDLYVGIGGPDYALACHNTGFKYFIPPSTGSNYTIGYVFEKLLSISEVPGGIGFDLFATRNGIVHYDSGIVLHQAGDFRSLCNAGDGVLYAGAANGNIWKSTDGGLTWTEIVIDATTAVVSIIQNNGRIIITDQYSSSIIRYTDDDFETVTVAEMLPGMNYQIIAVNDDVLLVANGTGDIWRSEDNGETWAEIEGNPQQGESSINDLILNYEYL